MRKDIGRIMRIIRQLHGIPLSDLAKELKISCHWISQIELGRKDPGFKLIEKYANHFGLEPTDLLLFARALDRKNIADLIRQFGGAA